MSAFSRRRFLQTSTVFLGAAAFPSSRTMADQDSAYDFIVIGAGASGCVLANRLSVDPSVQVLLIEAGGPPVNPLIPVPGQWTRLLGSEVDWKYATDPELLTNNRAIAWPRGRTFGGSTAISAMSYARGHQLCYDAWARTAGPSWAYREVLPLFRRSERNSKGASDYHGASGPWIVASTTDPHAGHEAFLRAARELGFNASPEWDFDGARQERGAGFYQKTIHQGRRQSVADAFLTPATSRPNLTVWPNTLALRLTFAGTRVTGVEVSRGGRVERPIARREVILSAGSLESPKVLMLSGLGPADVLRSYGIPVRVDHSGVGQNLQDHPRVGVRWDARQPLPGSTVTAGLFTSSGLGANDAAPDLQFYVGRGLSDPDPFVTLTVAMTQPRSRGFLTLRSADPAAAPIIRAHYFQESSDVEALVEGVRLARALADARPYAALRGTPVAPGPNVTSADGLRAFVRSTSETMFHPVGTCRMGSDAASVVDAELRVRGVEGLRVADASVIPTVINAQTTAACVMIGERASDLALGRTPPGP